MNHQHHDHNHYSSIAVTFPSLLYRRIEGRLRSIPFNYLVQRYGTYAHDDVTHNNYIPDPTFRILNPPVTTNHPYHNDDHTHRRRPRQTTATIKSFDLCHENRFLVSGNDHGIIRIYDISSWGTTDRSHRKRKRSDQSSSSSSVSIYEPIQQAMIPTTVHRHDSTTTTTASSSLLSSTIVSARWYPVDSGIFITASKHGSIHIWDTNEMISVMEMKPYQYENHNSMTSRLSSSSTSSSMIPLVSDMEPCHHHTNANMIGSCSMQSNDVKLMDLRTGSSMHTLSHRHKYATRTTGITTLCWSMLHPYLLATGSTALQVPEMSSLITLWDIRKSGSYALLTTLDHDNTTIINHNHDISEEYQPDGSNWRMYHHQKQQTTQDKQQPQQLQLRKVQQKVQSSINPLLRDRIKKRNDTEPQASKAMSRRLPNVAPNHYHDNVTPIMSISHGMGSKGISRLQFCYNGMLISTTISGMEISLWDLRSPSCPRIIQRPFVSSSSSGHHHPSRHIATADMIHIPLCITEHHSYHHKNHKNSNHHWIHSYNDHSVIWISKDAMIYGYSFEYGGTPQYILSGHLDTVTSMTIMKDGTNRLLSTAKDGMILVWKCRQKKKQQIRNHHHHNSTSKNNNHPNDETNQQQNSAIITKRSQENQYHSYDNDNDDVDSW